MDEKKRHIKVPVTALAELYVAALELIEGTEGAEVVSKHDPLYEALDKAFDRVFQSHWGGAIHSQVVAEKENTEAMLATADEIHGLIPPTLAAADAEPSEHTTDAADASDDSEQNESESES